MGFMAGFGEGFSSAFKNAQAIRASKEQDYFRVAYGEYSDKKKQYEEDEKRWSNSLTKGEAIAAKYGASPEAALKAAEWLNAGYSEEHTEELVKNATFSATVATPDQASDQNNLDGQMTMAGLTPGIGELPDPNANNAMPDPTQQAAVSDPASQDPQLLGNNQGPEGIFGESPLQNEGMLEGVRKVFPNAGESDMDQANRQVMEAGGMDQAAWDKTMGGFQTPDTSGINVQTKDTLNVPNPFEEFGIDLGQPLTKAKILTIDAAADKWVKSNNPDARAKAERWEALKPMVAEAANVDPETMAKLLNIIDPEKTRMSDISMRKAAAKTFLTDAIAIEKLAAETGGTALTAVGGFNAFVEELKTEGMTALNILGEYVGQTGSEGQAVADFTRALEESGNIDSNNKELARKQREYAATMVRMVYSLGRANGQTGNGFSNKDFDNFMGALQAGNDGKTFARVLRNIGISSLKGIDFEVQGLSESAYIKAAQKYDDLQPLIAPSLTLTTEDPTFAEFWEWTKNNPEDVAPSGDPTVAPNPAKPPAVDEGKPGAVRQDKKGIKYEFQGGDWNDPGSWKKVN